MRPAVDIVAERDRQRVRPAFIDIALDCGDRAIKQIEAAMNIADYVKPRLTIWSCHVLHDDGPIPAGRA